jgi:hypothetical protein
VTGIEGHPSPDGPESHWFRVAARTEAILGDPMRHGYSSPAEALASIAAQHQISTPALRHYCAAHRFLIASYPTLVSERPPEAGPTQILLFSRIHSVSQDDADRIVADVLAGVMGRRALEELLRRLREQWGSSVLVGSRVEGWRAAAAFEEAALTLVDDALHDLMDEEVVMARNWRCRGLAADAALFSNRDFASGSLRPEDARAVIEVKAPRRDVHRARAREIIGQNLLLQRVIPEVFTTLPWDDATIIAMKDIIIDFDIENMHILMIETLAERPDRPLRGVLMKRTARGWSSKIIEKDWGV